MFHKKKAAIRAHSTEIASSIFYRHRQAGKSVHPAGRHILIYRNSWELCGFFRCLFGLWSLCTFKEEQSLLTVHLRQTLLVPLVCVNAAISIGYCGSKIKPLRLRLFWNRPSALIAALTHTRCTREVFVISAQSGETVLLWTNKNNHERPKRHLKNPIIRAFL